MEAMVDTDWLIEQALEIPDYYISCNGPLSTETARQDMLFKFSYVPSNLDSNNDSAECDTIWSSSYKPNTPIPLKQAVSTFPHGGESGFKSWAISRMTITSTEALLQHHHGVDDIWQKFTSCFLIICGLFYTEPIFRLCIPQILTQLHNDGISYVEFRCCFGAPFQRVNSTLPDRDYMYFFECFRQELNTFLALSSSTGFWDARIIWTTIRSLPPATIQDFMQQCLDCKTAYQDLICGFDLVGQEDKGPPLIDLLPQLHWFRDRCVRQNLEIPFVFHAGECLGDGDSIDGNLFDAILMKSRRIGHAFSLYKHPILIDMVKENQILIETCPISHEILRLIGCIAAHPMPALQSRGVPIAIGNDDPAILGHGENGLTFDFDQVLIAYENTGLHSLGTMVENSILWSLFEDEGDDEWTIGISQSRAVGTAPTAMKAKRVQEWREAFEEWCRWVVENYDS
jgi:adenosine deaminase CECR1